MKYDAFISHASEEKAQVARPLAFNLAKRGYCVWYDEFTTRPGDSLESVLTSGLELSRFIILILSKAFFSKRWTMFELEKAFDVEAKSSLNRILPVWHDLPPTELAGLPSRITSTVACRTSDDIEVICNYLARSLRDPISLLETGNAQGFVRTTCSRCGKATGVFTNSVGTWSDCPNCGNLEALDGELDPSMVRFHQMRGYDDI